MCSSYGDFIYVNCNAGFHVLTEQHHRSCCCKWKLQKEVFSFICLVLFLYVDKQIFFCFLFEKEGKKWAWYLFMVTDTIVLKTWVLHPFQLLLGYAQTNPRIWFLSALLYYLGGSENWYFLIYNRREGKRRCVLYSFVQISIVLKRCMVSLLTAAEGGLLLRTAPRAPQPPKLQRTHAVQYLTVRHGNQREDG